MRGIQHFFNSVNQLLRTFIYRPVLIRTCLDINAKLAAGKVEKQ